MSGCGAVDRVYVRNESVADEQMKGEGGRLSREPQIIRVEIKCRLDVGARECQHRHRSEPSDDRPVDVARGE